MLHVLGPFRREGGIDGISLQHTQQLVLGSLAFMVVFLHWLTKPTKAAAGIGLANRKPCTVSQPACRNHARQSGVSTPSLPPPLSFSEDGCTERRSRLHYSSGGLDPSGNDRLLPAISGRREDFPQPAVRCGTANFQHMRVNHRRRDVGMAEQILHGSNVVTAAEQGRRERVAECAVWRAS